jgi:hypothetical protein
MTLYAPENDAQPCLALLSVELPQKALGSPDGLCATEDDCAC